MPYLFERRKFGLTASSGSTSQKVPTSLFCPMPMSKGSRTNSTLAPERYSATKPLARFSSAPEIRPLHFTVEWAIPNPGVRPRARRELILMLGNILLLTGISIAILSLLDVLLNADQKARLEV